MLSDEEIIEFIAQEIADRAVEEVTDELDGVSDPGEIDRRIIASIERQLAMLDHMLEDPKAALRTLQKWQIDATMYPMEHYGFDKPSRAKDETVTELKLPPLKPIPKVDQSEIDAINERVRDPKEQDRLAREFMAKYGRKT